MTIQRLVTADASQRKTQAHRGAQGFDHPPNEMIEREVLRTMSWRRSEKVRRREGARSVRGRTRVKDARSSWRSGPQPIPQHAHVLSRAKNSKKNARGLGAQKTYDAMVPWLEVLVKDVD
jgi:hypothetical protein